MFFVFFEYSENILLDDEAIDITDEVIDICLRDMHPQKALHPIDFTDKGIYICVSDLQ